MADNKKVQEEALKKLEDEAYFELCQIIAEAMQLQDVDLLNARIASWKNKYKKLLDRPSTNSKSDFKKRIEFLLNQYYSSVTQYILSQLKLKEEKKVENQSKALRELYAIIRDTNDYDLLKKKVDKWKEKYPVSGFLKMYQKRIELYTRDKNIRENTFKQEEAFRDLLDVTKTHGTLDEIKAELSLWEEKYSINDKFSIDDFINHQREVKRYTSAEFLQSIAREEIKPDNVDKTDIDFADEYNNKSFSNLPLQASAYAALMKISKSPNATSEMFTWVYKNRYIKFNDKYKELILSATYLEYSPTYLNKLEKPEMDMSKSSLSFDEYTNINDIKRYAIISYFNLLLPPDKAIPNDYFNKHIQTIYAKSEKARIGNDIKDETTSIEDVIDSGTEISYEPQNTLELKEAIINETPVQESTDEPEIVVDLSNSEATLTIDLEENNSKKAEEKSEETVEKISDTKPESVVEVSDEEQLEQEDKTTAKQNDTENSFDYTAVVSLAPLFFEAVNNYDKQAILVEHIDSTTTKYIEAEKAKEISLNKPIKTKIDEE